MSSIDRHKALTHNSKSPYAMQPTQPAAPIPTLDRITHETTRYEKHPPGWLDTPISYTGNVNPASRMAVISAAAGTLLLAALLAFLLWMVVSQALLTEEEELHETTQTTEQVSSPWDEEAQPLLEPLLADAHPKTSTELFIKKFRRRSIEPSTALKEIENWGRRLSADAMAWQDSYEFSSVRRRSEARNAWNQDRRQGMDRRSQGVFLHHPERSLDLEAQPL